MIDDAYADQCLRKFILEYLGKMLLKKNCRNCSNCLDKNETRMFKALLSQNVGYDDIRLVVAQYAQKAKGENKSYSKH
jgi:superfamily II DNA helicase RecQ